MKHVGKTRCRYKDRIWQKSSAQKDPSCLSDTAPTCLMAGEVREVRAKVAQSCLTLCKPLKFSMEFSSQNSGVGSHSLLQGTFPTRAQTLVSHVAGRFFSSRDTREAQDTGVGSLSLLQQIFLTQESNQGVLHRRWILYRLSHQGSPAWDRKASADMWIQKEAQFHVAFVHIPYHWIAL